VLAGTKGNRAVPGFVSDRLFQKEITMRGVLTASWQAFDEGINLLASSGLPIELMNTHTFALDQAQQAVLTMSGETEAAGVVAVALRMS
jgi:threonine dehydrogenase-like Zn-dependent dehydrogenase